jgi:hypothetical protein
VRGRDGCSAFRPLRFTISRVSVLL